MFDPPDNRAVSSLFRVFGGAGEPLVADTGELADCRAMHRGENAVLSVLVPVTALVAIGEPLAGSLGNVVGWTLALPATFLALNILPFLLAGKNPVTQWQLWLAACITWAGFHCGGAGVAAVLSYVWIGVAMLNLAAAFVLGWQASMRWHGKPGIVWRMFVLVLPHAAALGMGIVYGWPWAVASGALLAVLYCSAVLDPASQWLGPVYRTTDFERPLVTIDDGPDPRDTPVLLDLLDRFGVKAIFFMIGEKAQAHPELVREVIRRGHEIGNHTLTHPAGSFWCAGPMRTVREIAGCQDIIREITGVSPRWFRAPVGHRNWFTHPVATSLGLRVMGWNRRGYDAVDTDVARVLERILPGMTAGDIVLAHEATPIAADVLAAILETISQLETQGRRRM